MDPPSCSRAAATGRLQRLLMIVAATFVLVVWTGPASAQLPSEPIQLAGGRLVIAGEVSASIGSKDAGFFNYTDYEHSALRLLRLGLTASLEAGERVTLLGELRTENWDALRPFALYVRLRPWRTRTVDIQAGRIPPTFGAFGRRSYGLGNPLIGYPLIYQYLTSVRPDAFPNSADDLLRMRGRGWLVRYPLGAPQSTEGLPLASAFRWDTGLQIGVGSRPIHVSAALTTGSLSNPLFDDRNGGKQLAARVALTPTVGLIVGMSGARGEYAVHRIVEALPRGAGARLAQSALGFDVEYSRDHWLARAEGIFSWWDMPALSRPVVDGPLGAAGLSVEGRYTLRPGLYLAARGDRLSFSTITGTLFGGRPTPWDAPVSRLEIGGAYYLQRNLVAKLAYQYNRRDAGPATRGRFVAAQLLYWF